MTMRIHPELPIYFLDAAGMSILYAPGTLAVVERQHVEMIRQAWQQNASLPADRQIRPQMEWIADHARRALAARSERLQEEFAPECLMVYLSNFCNLRCRYCYAAAAGTRRPPSIPKNGSTLNPEIFAAAARLVAKNCAHKNKAFQLVVHGGGEPTRHWPLLLDLVDRSRAIADEWGLTWRGYIATNGVLAPTRAKWLGATFQRIGLSCDGPPDIQDCQRPTITGGPTSRLIETTARILREAGANLEIRATITPETIYRQQEIVTYCVKYLGAKSLRFEPVYGLANNPRSDWTVADAEPWAEALMAARGAALDLDADLRFSGIRLDELHGPYCNTLRQTLHLTPDGKATACFFCVDGNDPVFANRLIGEFDPKSKIFLLDRPKIDHLRQQAATIPDTCRDCFAACHCTRSCPEICAVNRTNVPGQEDFRCTLNRAIGLILLEDAARELILEARHHGLHQPARAPTAMQEVLTAVSSHIGKAVIEDWHALRSTYRIEDRGLPPPLWQKRGFAYDGERTWRELSATIACSAPNPISIYVHIPFCDRRCGFCDCYSFAVPPGHQLPHRYIQRMLHDIGHWAAIPMLGERPVTTIHFGGGTPDSLAPEDFAAIVSTLAERFNVRRETEWALETTAGHLSEKHLASLLALGFRRLHIGVQTLEEPLRQTIGRRLKIATVEERIGTCLQRGFITTVDLLYGLPGEKPEGFFATIRRLINMGVHGISFYRFNRSGRNRWFVRAQAAHEPDIIREYAMFMAADRIMTEAGYRKNHFCHYARAEDRNLYYTHARRGEDLLALGASADGVFAGLHYRCPNLGGKRLQNKTNLPILQGGIRENEEDKHISKIAGQLMTGSLELNSGQTGRNLIIDRWLSCRLLTQEENDGNLLTLQGNGSWLIRRMLQEIEKE